MADEKKLSLADLGVEESTEETTNTAPELPAVSEAKNLEDGTKVQTIVGDGKAEGPLKDEPKEDKRKILTPNDKQGSTPAKYTEVGDVNAFLGRKPKKQENPIRRTLDGFYELTDQGIDRTKKELAAPGGRIEEAKRKYIEWMYPKLEERARTNSRLMEHMKRVNEIMDTDPRFDGITELERHAYLLFVVGHADKEKIGVDHEYFGVEEKDKDSRPKLSADNQKEIDAILEEKYDFTLDDDDFEETVGLDPGLAIYKSPKPEVSVTSEKPDTSKATVEDDTIKLDEEINTLGDDLDDLDDDKDDDDDDLDLIPEEEVKQNRKDYKQSLIKELKLDRTDDIADFKIGSKPISIKAALVPKKIEKRSFVWPLPYTGICVEMTPLSGDEILQLNPTQTDFNTVTGLNAVFNILYRHIINHNKQPWETWLRQVCDYDIDSLIFAAHAATFKETNYLTYECKNSKCKKISLKKKDIMEMIVFPNDETKKRFDDILAHGSAESKIVSGKPVMISENYAIEFVSKSIYSSLFEPAALPKEIMDKYSPIISLMPNIGRVYRIDKVNKILEPINFGVIENSISKTVQRKVKSLITIFASFTPDERAICISEVQKILTSMEKWNINYVIPETVCPYCNSKIEKQETNPLGLLFTRAQLPTVAAFMED